MPELTPLGEDWTEINGDDLLFEEEKVPTSGILGRVRSTLVGTNSHRILPKTAKHVPNQIKKSIFGLAGKIKEKLKKPEEPPQKEESYIKQLGSEYESSTDDER